MHDSPCQTGLSKIGRKPKLTATVINMILILIGHTWPTDHTGLWSVGGKVVGAHLCMSPLCPNTGLHNNHSVCLTLWPISGTLATLHSIAWNSNFISLNLDLPEEAALAVNRIKTERKKENNGATHFKSAKTAADLESNSFFFLREEKKRVQTDIFLISSMQLQQQQQRQATWNFGV